VWTHFKNGRIENPIRGFELETEWKMPMMDAKIQMGTTTLGRCDMEGR
jgi:hypothetical protein